MESSKFETGGQDTVKPTTGKEQDGVHHQKENEGDEEGDHDCDQWLLDVVVKMAAKQQRESQSQLDHQTIIQQENATNQNQVEWSHHPGGITSSTIKQSSSASSILSLVEGEDMASAHTAQRLMIHKDRMIIDQLAADESCAVSQVLVVEEPESATTPGAFAVGGINDNVSTTSGPQVNNSTPTTATTTSDTVIDGAIVVEDGAAGVIDRDRLEEGTFPRAPTTRRKSQEVIDGTIMPANNFNHDYNNSKSGQPVAWWCLACVGIVGLVVFLALYLPSLSSSPSSSSLQQTHGTEQYTHPKDATSTSPSPLLYPPFRDDLHPQTLGAIQDPSTPEYKANAWMLNDPNLHTYSPERQRQRFEMAYAYYITNGINWTRNDHWLSYEVNECDWFSQAHNKSISNYDNYPICDENNTLLILNLNSNNLQGTLPLFEHYLPNLMTFDFGNNHLHGQAPSGPAATSEAMQVFIISNNQFEGQLVSTGGFKPLGLRVVKIDGNALFGYQPALYIIMNQLEVLNHTGNKFDGKITDYVGNLKKLVHFEFGDNLHTGTLPTVLGQMRALETIDFHDNAGLTGWIPTELGQLNNLTLFDIRGTNITGPVPAKLCERAKEGLVEIRANCSLVECCSNK